MLPASIFDRFRQAILSLPVMAENEKYNRTALTCPRFLLFREAGLEAYYAPFHHLNKDARLVLIGLTPGWTQMERAFRAARIGLSCGLDCEPLFEYVYKTASFSGPMRKNLVEMLDGIGLNALLGIPSCVDLFDASSHMVHFTSAVSAPIFRNGENYRGYGPPLLQVPKLREWVIGNLGMELMSVPKAVILPLGRVASEAVQFLNERNDIGLDRRCLTGFPHPSGANGHRRSDFQHGRERWSSQLAAWFAADRKARFSPGILT